MRGRIAVVAAIAATSFGAFAATASAAGPVAQLCGSASVTVNGNNLVNQATCESLPPGS